jgi:hypothetical protein
MTIAKSHFDLWLFVEGTIYHKKGAHYLRLFVEGTIYHKKGATIASIGCGIAVFHFIQSNMI